MGSPVLQFMSIVLGLIIGSFLTVCIYRVPLRRSADSEEDSSELDLPMPPVATEKIGINNPPRSLCPKCGTQLKAWHNIPLVSWIFLKGRCAHCQEKISIRYPLVEVLTAGACWLSYATYGLTPTALIVFLFTCALIVISFIDYDYYIIPNVISLPGVIIGCALSVLNQFTSLFSLPVVPGIKESLLGILAGGGFLLLVSETYFLLRKKEGLGMGDVKLLGMTGAFFGWQGSLYTIFVGSLLGSVGGILLTIFLGRKMSKPLPFGPYLALGTFLYIFFGPLITGASRFETMHLAG